MNTDDVLKRVRLKEDMGMVFAWIDTEPGYIESYKFTQKSQEKMYVSFRMNVNGQSVLRRRLFRREQPGDMWR